jgi:4-hydroxy-2-oxoheptanedioate aldolase
VPRVNRAVELLAQGQPIYYESVALELRSYEGGRESAGTWADFLMYDMEHSAFDMTRLSDFMRGLVDGGPTRSGHRTPAVIATLPTDGSDETTVRANAWMCKQVLATGVHGILLCHAETPAAVRTFVEACRYPFAPTHAELGVGRRGGGGQKQAAAIWGMEQAEYLQRADPWPLNPAGEILLGLKIENTRALANAEASTRVPGIGFAEWGPGDMGMSMGYPDNHDEPFPEAMTAARSRVLAACKAAGIAFLNTVYARDVTLRIDEGVMIGSASHGGQEAAEIGRKYTKRTMPW